MVRDCDLSFKDSNLTNTFNKNSILYSLSPPVLSVIVASLIPMTGTWYKQIKGIASLLCSYQ